MDHSDQATPKASCPLALLTPREYIQCPLFYAPHLPPSSRRQQLGLHIPSSELQQGLVGVGEERELTRLAAPQAHPQPVHTPHPTRVWLILLLQRGQETPLLLL